MTQTTDIDTVLAQLAELLRGASEAAPGENSSAAPDPPAAAHSERLASRQQLANDLVYAQAIPPVTADVLESLDDFFADATEHLRSLDERPYLRSQIDAAIAEVAGGTAERQVKPTDDDGWPWPRTPLPLPPWSPGPFTDEDGELNTLLDGLAGGDGDRVGPFALAVGAIGAFGVGLAAGKAAYHAVKK